MGDRMTPERALRSGLVCLALAGLVIGLTVYRQASWSLDGIEAVVVLVPVGIYLTLKGLGWDLALELRLLLGGRRRDEDER